MANGSEERLSEIPPERLKQILRSIKRPEFDRFIATLWQHHGWETTVYCRSADVLATAPENEDLQYAIHTADYRTHQQISGADVAQHAKQHEDSERVTPVVVTTGQFSWEAKERAKTVGANVVDGDDLVNKIESAEAYETVGDHAPILMETESISELETTLDQRHSEPDPRNRRNQDIEGRGSAFWLTSLPGIRTDRNWARRLVVLMAAFVALVSVYNTVPAEGSVVARLTRILLYFSTIGTVFGIMISFYMDINSIRQAETYWNPSPLLYGLLVAFTFGIAWLFYFYKRRYHFGKATARPPQETA